ncbi:MAG: PCRF domain-containing protein, partial [Burkholderiales bacterium]|nr:PCRF domain-containing protein [Burkholderiales bacterium]
MKASVAAKLASLVSRARELDALLADPEVTANLDNYRKLSKEHADISPVVARYGDYAAAEADVAAAEEMARDPEMRDFAEGEIREGRARLEEIAADIQRMLLPKDPNDERNLFLEIRAGTGGDESALFAGDLFRMYSRFAERNRWQVEVVSESPGDAGGYKEIIARIAGQGAYSRLKFESGGHRVQRVPATETQGRIHT